MQSDLATGRAMKTEVATLDDLPEGWLAQEWWSPAVASRPGRAVQWAADARWDVRFVVARLDGGLAGVLPVGGLRVAKAPDESYSCHALLAAGSADERDWLVLGGGRDLAGGVAVTGWVPDSDRAAVVTALTRRALDEAAGQGRRPAFLYLPEAQREAVVEAFENPRLVPLGELAVLATDHPDLDHYLLTLPSGRRNKIRRDWRAFQELGLSSEWVDAQDALEEAAPLVTLVKAVHGIPDHPRFARLRLEAWIAAGVGRCRAVMVRDSTGLLVAASFVSDAGESLEVYEVGLADDPSTRLPGYLETCYYAPLREAVRLGRSRLELGMEAAAAKRSRGAVLSPVWAVTEST